MTSDQREGWKAKIYLYMIRSERKKAKLQRRELGKREVLHTTS